MIPLYLLDWLGLSGLTIARSFGGRLFIKLLTGIIAILTVVSSVVSLVVGWDGFVDELVVAHS